MNTLPLARRRQEIGGILCPGTWAAPLVLPVPGRPVEQEGQNAVCTAASLVKVWPPRVHLSCTPSLQEVEVYTLNKVVRRNFHGKRSGPELQVVALVPPKAGTTRPLHGKLSSRMLVKACSFQSFMSCTGSCHRDSRHWDRDVAELWPLSL